MRICVSFLVTFLPLLLTTNGTDINPCCPSGEVLTEEKHQLTPGSIFPLRPEMSLRCLQCLDEEPPVVEDQRFLTGILYPSALLISAIFTFITIIFYLTVGSLRKTLYGKITLGFLLNVFICYLLLAIVYNYDRLGDGYRDFLGSDTCRVLGYIIHHTFIAFFFWMSAMAFNIAKSLSTMKLVR